MKQEIWPRFIEGVSKAYDQITTTLDQEITFGENSPYMGQLDSTIVQQLDEYGMLIESKISEHHQKWLSLRAEVVDARKACVELEEAALEFQQWRLNRRNHT